MKRIVFCLSILGILSGCVTSMTREDIDGTRIYFDFDSAVISKQSRLKLEDVAFAMRRDKSINIIIDGHTDIRGAHTYNYALGSLRAGNVAHVIMQEGVEPERVKTKSYGKKTPAATGDTDEAHQENRNVTIWVQ